MSRPATCANPIGSPALTICKTTCGEHLPADLPNEFLISYPMRVTITTQQYMLSYMRTPLRGLCCKRVSGNDRRSRAGHVEDFLDWCCSRDTYRIDVDLCRRAGRRISELKCTNPSHVSVGHFLEFKINGGQVMTGTVYMKVQICLLSPLTDCHSIPILCFSLYNSHPKALL